MILFKKAGDLHKWLETQQKKDNLVGFVPTMGALHAGHISLIKASKKKNSITVSSIFINPTQFNDPKDFEKYPITLEKDIAMLEAAGNHVLFLPSEIEIYPDGLNASTSYDLGYLETVLEGKFRPGHFQGVCMVVERLLQIVQPDNLYIGQKDYQQCIVISKLIELKGLIKKISVHICPTIREKDGLAMSSRNIRLKEKERKNAITIYQSLALIKNNLHQGNIDDLKKDAQTMLTQAGLKIDYVEIADAKNLSLISKWDGNQKLVALIAAFINDVRLIDNMLLQ